MRGLQRWWVALGVLAVAGFTAAGARADYPHVDKRFQATTFFSANRPFDLPIDSIMIHDTEETYEGTIAAFTNPRATAAVQYAISGEDNSSDPAVTQFVADKDWTRSVNNWWYNRTSIGLEHIGFAMAPVGYFTQRLYQRSADVVGWEAWKYRIPLDRAHILGHDNIPNSIDNATVQHWDPGPYWDWPYYMDLVREAYERWAHGAAPPKPEIPARYTKLNPKIREISVGDDFAAARDWFRWTTGFQSAFANVHADHGGPLPTTLARGASDPSTYIPSTKLDGKPKYDKLDFSCDNFPQPEDRSAISPVAASDLRAKAAWGEDFALLGRRRVRGVLYDKIDFSGAVNWVRDSDTSDGWGALVQFRGGSAPTTLYSGPEYPAHYPPPKNPELDTRICPDTQYGFSRAGQTYVAQLRRSSQGRTWYQIDYNHRTAWVPADEVAVVSSATGSAPTGGRG